MRPPRKRARAIAQGRGRDHRVVIPLAFEVAARISARPIDEFRHDPTQLANGLAELNQAIGADGIVCAAAGEMELRSADGRGLSVEPIAANGPVAASLEACRRLRQSGGDEVALLAGLTGPATLGRQFSSNIASAAEAFSVLVKKFCEAGADVVLVFEDEEPDLDGSWTGCMKTADNIARFHQAALLLYNGDGFPAPHKLALEAPAAEGVGFITTAAPVPADADIAVLKHWVTTVKGRPAQ